MDSRNDTIAAISTAPGRGGIAVVRISGADAWAVAGKVTGRRFRDGDAGRFFRACFAGVDDGIALVFKGPRSYTGDDSVELQGHGGAVAPRRVLEACLAAGARLARRGEFTERAFLNGKLDLGMAEAVIDLIDAHTGRAAADAFARLGGALSRPLERIYAEALEISASLEYALDCSEEDLPEDFQPSLFSRISALAERMRSICATAREGRLLREGALVVLAGAPNAGKSSLLNALLGENRAIVSPSAGTTRDSIEEWMEIDGWPVRLSDTAGLRDADDPVEAEGVGRARRLIDRADVAIALDCDIPGALRIHAKCDLDAPGEAGGGGVLRVSAKTGEGLDSLKAAIAGRLEKLASGAAEGNGADATTRQQTVLAAAADALSRALEAPDLAAAACETRKAAEKTGEALGKTYSEDLLDALFSRFCVGK